MKVNLKMRMISFLLCVVMLVSILPISVMGQTDDNAENELITIQMFDVYGDGWNGAAIDVYEDGIPIGTAMAEEFYESTWTCAYDSSKEYEFFWIEGAYDGECSFNIYYGDKLVYVADMDRCNSYTNNNRFYPVCISHVFSVTDVVEPSCNSDGFTIYTCEICGWYYTGNYVTSTIEHIRNEDTVAVIEPTCTENGYTMYECSECRETVYEDYVDSLGGHTKDFDTAVVTEPTCTEDGYTTYTCSVCEEIFSDDYVSAEHDFVQVLITEPTCVSNGYTTYKCKYCDVYNNDDYIDALGHTKKLDTAKITEPTCDKEGYTTYECSVCNAFFEDDYVEPVGHIIDLDTAVVTEPTCTEEGYTTYECSVCNAFFEDDYVEPLGHTKDLDTAVVTKPTCTENGYTTYECSLCEALIYDDYKSLLGHTLGDNGNCTVCGDLYTIPVWIAGNQIEATNINDVLGDGTVSYDIESNTLTLENVNYYDSDSFLYSEIPLNIVFKGNSFLRSENYNMYFDITNGNINIGGDGTVEIIYSESSGIVIEGKNVGLIIGDSIHLSIMESDISSEYQQDGIYIQAININTVVKDNATVKLGSISDLLDEEGFYLSAEEKNNVTIKDNADLIIFTDDEEGIYLDGKEQYVGIEGNVYIKIISEEESIDAANVNISGGTISLEAGDDYEAIYADNVTINGGIIIATGDYAGINAEESIVINGGNITAIGTSIEIYSYGINVDGVFEMNGGSLTAAGNEDGIYIDGEAIINSGTIKVNKGGLWLEKFDLEQEIDVPGKITIGSHIKVVNPEDGSICVEYVDEDNKSYTCVVDGEGKEAYSFIITDNNVGEEHLFVTYVSDGNATCTENGTKTAKCDYGCGATDTIIDEGSMLEHEFTTYISDGNATCTENGTKTAKCDYGCETTDTIIDEGSMLDHEFTTYISDGNATCTENGTKTAKCDYGCGATDTIIDEGSMLEHVFTTYISDGNATCTENGTKTAKCDYGCETTDTIIDEGSMLEHEFTTYISDGNVTCTEDGTKTAKCDYGCETTDVVVEEALGHDIKDYVCQRCKESFVVKIRLVDDSELMIEENVSTALLIGVEIDLPASYLMSNIKNTEGIQIVNLDKNALNDSDKLGTGFAIQLIKDGEVVDELIIVVNGDVDGDTQRTAKDVANMRRFISGWDVSFVEIAADLDGDTQITAKDVALERRAIAGWN